MNELYITLYDEAGNEVQYQVEQIFPVDGVTQLYCCAVPTSGGETVFLRCAMRENGEHTEIAVADIPDSGEYTRVVEAYRALMQKEMLESFKEDLAEPEDIITLTDADGDKINFIIHTIFEDELAHRSYVALQRVEGDGRVAEEISLYRFLEEGNDAMIDMIPSDMEYDRARNLFMELIERQ